MNSGQTEGTKSYPDKSNLINPKVHELSSRSAHFCMFLPSLNFSSGLRSRSHARIGASRRPAPSGTRARTGTSRRCAPTGGKESKVGLYMPGITFAVNQNFLEQSNKKYLYTGRAPVMQQFSILQEVAHSSVATATDVHALCDHALCYITPCVTKSRSPKSFINKNCHSGHP